MTTGPQSAARRVAVAALALLLSSSIVAGRAAAAGPESGEPDYRDDRSSGAAVVESLYNAVDRHEILRAYSYFGEGPDRPDFESFAKGYANTEHVRLKLGPSREEGAAGSLYTDVPAAIEATTKGGKTQVYTGCYVTRLVQPQMQEQPPYRPRHIEKATLAPTFESFDAVTPRCPDS